MDFFPLTIDFEEKMYAAGKIPGCVLPARGAAFDGSDPQRATDGPPAAPALSEGHAQRSAGRHHGDVGRQGECTGRAGHGRRVGGAVDLERAVRGAGVIGARGLHRRQVHREPDVRAARREHDRHRRRWDEERDHDGGGGCERSAGGDHPRCDGVRAAAEPDPDRTAGRDRRGAEARQVGVHARRGAGRAEEAGLRGPGGQHRRVPGAGEGRAAGLAEHAQGDAGREVRRRVHGEGRRRSARRVPQEDRARIDPERQQAARRAQVGRSAADLVPGGRAAACPRHRAVHARTDAGAERYDAGRRRRCAAARYAVADRQQAVHAPLQLPAVLGRRDGSDGWRGPSRDRPRRAR